MLTANKLISRVLRRCYWPTNSSTGLGQNAPLSDADILEIADEELLGDVYPQLIAANADYSLATLNYAITAEREYYRVPLHAYGPIADVLLVTAAGDEFSMAMFKLEDVGRPERRNLDWRVQYEAVLDGDFFRLSPVPTTTTGDTLRIRYYHAPSKLALLAACGQISARATVTVLGVQYDRLTYSGADLSGGVPNANVAVDVIGAAGAHAITSEQAAADTVMNTTTAAVLAASNDWGQAQAGDYIALSGYTPIVQIPELQETQFVVRVAAACLRAKKDFEAAAQEEGYAERLEKKADQVISPRAAQPDYIVTRNSHLRRGSIPRRIR